MPGLGRILYERLDGARDRRVACFIAEAAETVVTAGGLIALASAVADRIRALGLPARSLVGVALYSGPELYAAWLGCLWAGHVPTMIAPPSPRMEPAKYARGVAGIVGGLGVAALVLDRQVEAPLLAHLAAPPPVVHCDDLAAGGEPEVAEAGPDEVAVIQHSSGTTGQQKAVALTTAEILAHQAAYGERLAVTPDDRIVSWLPLYHDMGFVAAFLQPLLAGIEIVEMSPFAWANRPAMLLEAIDRHRPTLCWMPNFAFALMAEPRVLRGLGDLDLSSVRAWVNCSEPVMATSFDRFAEALAPYGVSQGALTASYAMAENVFAVTQSQPGAARRLIVDRQALERDGQARPATSGDAASVTLVSNGTALPTTEIEVRVAEGARLADGMVGELHLRGTHRFAGYHNRPDLTDQAIDAAGWYATGDLGFVLDGEVYVTGRKKDLIILRGRNYAAHDIETAIGELPGIKSGRVVAFSLPDSAVGTERLVILAEAEADAEAGPLGLDVRKCVAQTFDTTVSDVRILPDRWLVKSTSGKLARGDNRAKYLATWGA